MFWQMALPMSAALRPHRFTADVQNFAIRGVELHLAVRPNCDKSRCQHGPRRCRKTDHSSHDAQIQREIDDGITIFLDHNPCDVALFTRALIYSTVLSASCFNSSSVMFFAPFPS